MKKRGLKAAWVLLDVTANFLIVFCCIIGMTHLSQAVEIPLQQDGKDNTILAHEILQSGGLLWRPVVEYSGFLLTVTTPHDSTFQQESAYPDLPYFPIVDSLTGTRPNGRYGYELVLLPPLTPTAEREFTSIRRSGDREAMAAFRNALDWPDPLPSQSGKFTLTDGVIALSEEGTVNSDDRDANAAFVPPADQVISDDLIINGSLCVGNDCYNGLAFGFDTIVLMENNLRIFFDDTSSIQNYPRNDWRIIINDSTDGGDNYFALQDATEVTNILTIEAGAPNHSLYVDSHGDVGVGTSSPYYELHIKDGDSPAIRLDQDGSYGWTPQKWDLCGNESNFFIRDATHASKLPFRILPNAPTDSLFIKEDGKIGLGTGSPLATLHLQTYSDPAFRLEKAGAENPHTWEMALEETHLLIREVLDTPKVPVKIKAGAPTGSLEITENGDIGLGTDLPQERLHVEGNTYISGSLELGSSRQLKEKIQPLPSDLALAAIDRLKPVLYHYKREPRTAQAGFIAEDMPDLLKSKSGETVKPMDIIAVLTRVVQRQQQTIARLEQRMAILESSIQQESAD